MKDPLSLSSLFSAFGNDLAAVSDKKSLLQLIATHLSPHLTFSDILLSVANEDKQTHSVFLHHCDPVRQSNGEYASLSQEKFRMDDGVCNITMASPSPLVVDIAGILLRPEPPRYISRWYRPAISRMIGVRLRSHNQLLGALFFFFEKAHIGIHDLDLVQHFSYMMAPALKNILTDERISLQQRDNEILLALSTDLVKIRNKDDLFRLVDIRLPQLFEFDHSHLFLADEGTSGGMIDATLNARHPLVFDLDKPSPADMPAYIRQYHEKGMREAVMMALRKEGESFGLLALFSGVKGWFTSRYLELMRTLSIQLSVALTNILTHEAVQERENDRSLILSLAKDLISARNKTALLAVVERALRHIAPYNEITISRREENPVQDGIYEILLQSEAPMVYNTEREMVAIPLREDSKVVGGIFIYFRENGLLTPRNLSLLQELCTPMSISVANLWAYERVESELEEIHHYKSRLQEENLYLQGQIMTAQGFTGIIGSGSAMQKVFQLVSIAGPTDSTVLLLGETGTGKELVAKAIHNASPRKDKFMIKVDCAAQSADLVESELFGHETGSLPGVVERRIGKFGLADGGTLFLDKIGELSPGLQLRLLKAMQENKSVRIIAATNRDLQKEVEAGRFRSDLYNRLNVFPISLPALRDRKEDLPTLASHFISVQNQRTGKKIANISQRALESLMRYDWPGNVRELERLIERSVLMTTGHTIKEISLPADTHTVLSDLTQDTSFKTLDELEKEHILSVLKKCNHKIGGPGGAAELLRLPATTLHSKIRKLGIK